MTLYLQSYYQIQTQSTENTNYNTDIFAHKYSSMIPFSKLDKKQNLTGLQLKEYFQTIFNTLKAVAFHEIYMENQREQVCKNELFDPLTAFKAMDTIKHNKIVSFQLRGFIQRESNGKFKPSDFQCEEALTCLNKGLFALSFEDFQQIILPRSIPLRNKVQNRYNQVQIKVGTMTKVYDIKDTSGKKISAFFTKQIQFYRELLLRRQNFCQKYGGDLYTFTQAIGKGKSNKFTYHQFYQFCRQHKFYFNSSEFIAIYKRTKNVSVSSPLAYDNVEKIQIQIDSLSHCFLTTVKNMDVKNKIRIIGGEKVDFTQPSYRNLNVYLREKNKKQEEKLEQKHKYIQEEKNKETTDKRDIRYHYHYGNEPGKNHHRKQLNLLNEKWNQEVRNMRDAQIDIRYSLIDKKHYFI